jgi:DNA repair exonuclease SbcCD ATPase subunit
VQFAARQITTYLFNGSGKSPTGARRTTAAKTFFRSSFRSREVAKARSGLAAAPDQFGAMTTTSVNSDVIRESFRVWHTERDSLDVQLSESLAALAAYQSHLDAWQQELGGERETLRIAREKLDLDQAAAAKSDSEAAAALTAELNAARDKIGALTTSLLSRTEELRDLDNRRAEVVTELELARAREKELRAAVEEQKRAAEQERSQRAEELRQLHEILQRQLDVPPVEVCETAAQPEPPSLVQQTPPAVAQQSPPPLQQPSPVASAHAIPRESPVLGSIVEQFGKLRQQRAIDRQASTKPR